MLDLKLSNSIKLRLNSSSIYCSIAYSINLPSLDTLDLRMPCTEAYNLVLANRS
jgi:hypothetical protein